jgi:hypothetical protein
MDKYEAKMNEMSLTFSVVMWENPERKGAWLSVEI